MKKYILSILIVVVIKVAVGQNMELVTHVPYADYAPFHHQLFIRDSLVYTIRSGGLQIFNLETENSAYEWANRYQLLDVLPDSANKYVFLKASKFIGRYNHTTMAYENIADATFQGNTSITQIGISPNHKIWAASGKKVGVFNGVTWQWKTFTNLNNIIGMLVANDTVAFIADSYYKKIYRYSNDTAIAIYSVGSFSSFKDWVVSNQNVLWLAMKDSMISIDGGTVTTYDANNSPLGSNKFYYLSINSSGHLYVADNAASVYKYDGSNFTNMQQPAGAIRNIAVDESDSLYVVIEPNYNSNRHLYIKGSGAWHAHKFHFFPYKNARVIKYGQSGGSQIATDEGIFEFQSSTDRFKPTNFRDTSSLSYANDVTCFANSDNNTPSYAWGTHHGVLGININNALLPDTNINCILLQNGAYYIGTDKGLCLYTQLVYVTFDTSNSPLPSQKITCLITDDQNRLYVGTDKGVAVYFNNQWQVFDTSNVPISSFYVTDIFPPFYGDTSIWATTLGSGIAILNFTGSNTAMNTQNGLFEDDSLYYIKQLMLGKCGQMKVIGTKHHGVANSIYWGNQQFQYSTIFNNYPDYDTIHSSTAMGTEIYGYTYAMLTDNGIAWGSACGSINEATVEQTIKWNIEGNTLSVFTPDNFNGPTQISLFDVLGRQLLSWKVNSVEGEISSMDVGALSRGFYVLSMENKTGRATGKVVYR